MRSLAVMAALALLAPAVAEAASPRLVKVPATTRAERARIASWGMEVVEAQESHLTIALQPDKSFTPQVNRELSTIPGVQVLSEDVDEMFRQVVGKAADAGLYHTYEEAKADLTDLATRFPAIASMQSLGKSVEGRDIIALKITGPNASGHHKPVFLFMGCHHAREWISVEVPLAIAKNFCENYATDAGLKALIDSREIWVCPMVNPDGLTYSQNNYKYWRKTRQKNANGTFGVDPNRNYGYKWGTAGDSGNPDSDTYRGTAPFSEPETQNIRDFAKNHLLTTSISFHSYGERVMYPFSYGYVQTPDDALFKNMSVKMAALNKYQPHQSVDLYPSSGDTDDHLYAEAGAMAFTFEVGRTFIPSESEIAKICADNVKAVRLLVEQGAEPFPFLKHTPPAAVAGTLSMSATFDRAHHPTVNPVEVKLHVANGAQIQEVAMTADAANPDVFNGTLQGAPISQPGTPVEYFFTLKDKDGHVVRVPRLSNFTAAASPSAPTALLAPPAGHLMQMLGF